MKANEFVRKFGLDAAKHKADELKIIESMGDKLSFEDENLKRLVESYELIGRNDGIESAKMMIERTKFPLSDRIIRLKRAIADVESCMEEV